MDYEECTSLNAMNGTAIGKKLTEPSVVISTLQEKKKHGRYLHSLYYDC